PVHCPPPPTTVRALGRGLLVGRWVVSENDGMRLPIMPPVKPMLAKPVKEIPRGELSYEPKWDGFRSIIFRDGDEVEIGSRNEKPMTRYFPELVEAVQANLPELCAIDGEIILIGQSRGQRPIGTTH